MATVSTVVPKFCRAAGLRAQEVSATYLLNECFIAEARPEMTIYPRGADNGSLGIVCREFATNLATNFGRFEGISNPYER